MTQADIVVRIYGAGETSSEARNIALTAAAEFLENGYVENDSYTGSMSPGDRGEKRWQMELTKTIAG